MYVCVFHQQLAFTKVILTLFACITRKFVCVCVPPAISIHQTLEPSVQGKASFQLIAEYYNRNLSGWEPFLEPWRSGTAPTTPLTLPLASCFCYTLSHLLFSSLHHDIRDVLYTKIVQSFLQHAKKKKKNILKFSGLYWVYIPFLLHWQWQEHQLDCNVLSEQKHFIIMPHVICFPHFYSFFFHSKQTWDQP